MCHSREEAEELVQQTFARVLRKPRLLRSDDDLGYLLRALRNTFISQRRAAPRRPQTPAPPDQFDRAEDWGAGGGEARLESAEVYAAIAALPEDLRDALVALDLVGLSYRQRHVRWGFGSRRSPPDFIALASAWPSRR